MANAIVKIVALIAMAAVVITMVIKGYIDVAVVAVIGMLIVIPIVVRRGDS